ncbi:DUF1934 domain-containing protein [Lentibacillus cibarius]|uniref:DUF1934 domain-containing protein n=1 Tax=Lentibacillus cibarius TaxID=2583219 RepID=A0A549YG40_9BACI|nr:DUF1934 domain-containing protein [Lentibacillus cibarius]TRM10807.1 DUF1934 domain-containing protein [Lentibacillus cibarius]
MNDNAKQVAIELRTAIADNGEMEYNTVRQMGRYYQQEKMDVLTFNETMDDGSQVSNMVTIYNDKVSIKRKGPVAMHQQFRQYRSTENVYQHPHGNIHMETYTKRMNYQRPSLQEAGQLTIDYTVKLNGQEERTHQLTLNVRNKEDSE